MATRIEKINFHAWRGFNAEFGLTLTSIRMNLRVLGSSFLYIGVPWIILCAMGFSYLFRDHFSLTQQFTEGPFYHLDYTADHWERLQVDILFAICAVMPITLISAVTMRQFVKKKGVTAVTWAEFLPEFLKRLPALILIYLVVGGLMFGGSLLLIFPSVFTFHLIYSSFSLYLDRDVAPLAAIRDSLSLMVRQFGPNLYFIGGMLTIFVVIYLLKDQAAVLMEWMLSYISDDVRPNNSWGILLRAVNAMTYILSFFLFYIPAVGACLRYYGASERATHRYLTERIDAIGEPAPLEDIYAEEEHY